MPIYHSLSILLNRYALVFKIIMYFLIVTLLLGIIALAILSPALSGVLEQIESTGFFSKVLEGLRELISGNPHSQETLQEVNGIWSSIVNSFTPRVQTTVLVVVIVFVILTKFIYSLAYISYSDIINNFMSSNARYGFISNFISNLKRSLVYGLLNLVTSFPYDIAVLVSGYFIFIGITKAINFLVALPILMIYICILMSLKSTLFSGWLPGMVRDNKKIHVALRESASSVKKIFINAFGIYVVAYFLAAMFIVLSFISTFGAGLIISIPTAITFFITLESVIYYNATNHKYYINEKTIIQAPVIISDKHPNYMNLLDGSTDAITADNMDADQKENNEIDNPEEESNKE